MSEKHTFSVRLAPDKPEQLDRLAPLMGRPQTALVAQAIDQFLAYRARKQERVEKCRVAADRGELALNEGLFGRLCRRESSMIFRSIPPRPATLLPARS